MAVAAKRLAEFRWQREFRSAETFTDDLGSIGAWVGPRTGPDKRTHGEKEDYVLRRLLVAWKETGRLEYPLEISATTDQKHAPDFILAWSNGEFLGVEVTEAGDESYQAWLTRTEDEDKVEAYRKDGYVGDEPERDAAGDILDAIRRKVAAYNEGKYQTTDSCDLLVYDNSETGWMADKEEVVKSVGSPNDVLDRFRQIHLVKEATVFLDLFGDNVGVDVGQTYEIDYAKWVSNQVERMRLGSTDDLDFARIAEELESLGISERKALGSHLRNLLLPFLKWQFQPERRGQSWRLSIDNARSEIFERLTEMPSLRRELKQRIASEYGRARRTAAIETELELATFPDVCPYELEQLLDPDFLPHVRGAGVGG